MNSTLERINPRVRFIVYENPDDDRYTPENRFCIQVAIRDGGGDERLLGSFLYGMTRGEAAETANYLFAMAARVEARTADRLAAKSVNKRVRELSYVLSTAEETLAQENYSWEWEQEQYERDARFKADMARVAEELRAAKQKEYDKVVANSGADSEAAKKAKWFLSLARSEARRKLEEVKYDSKYFSNNVTRAHLQQIDELQQKVKEVSRRLEEAKSEASALKGKG